MPHWRHPQAPTTHPVTEWLIAAAAVSVIAVVVLLGFGLYGQFK